jgi:2-dehydropantoate 2-reductase
VNIVIAGPGALGLRLAAGLSLVCEQEDGPILLDHRKNRAKQLTDSGFFLREQEKTAVHYKVAATTDPAVARGCDLLFICTRMQDVASCLQRFVPFLAPSTILVFAQRGVAHIEQPPVPRSAALVWSGDCFLEPKNLLICKNAGSLQFGPLDNTLSRQECRHIVDLLDRSGPGAALSHDIRRTAWERFCFDAAVNPLAAIYRRPNGRLLTSCSVRGNLKKFIGEVQAVAHALGVVLDNDPVATVFQLLRRNKDALSPMLRDVRLGRATEIDCFCGYISQTGRNLGIPTPISDDLLQRIQMIEARYP